MGPAPRTLQECQIFIERLLGVLKGHNIRAKDVEMGEPRGAHHDDFVKSFFACYELRPDVRRVTVPVYFGKVT